MTTFYDRLLIAKDSTDLFSDILDEISQKLLQLLYESCHIDLSHIDEPFVMAHIGTDKDLHIQYNTVFGGANFSLLSSTHELEVEFDFSKEYPTDYYYKSKYCYLEIDNDMNLKKTRFNNAFPFSKAVLDGAYTSHVFSSLRIDTYVDYLSNVSKHFSYENYLYHTFPKDMRAYGLSAYFYFTNKDFEDLLATFLVHAGNYPFIFYEFFKEYPSYIDLMNSIDNMIQFLELFKTQYINDPDLLKSKILLIEMKLI